MSKTIHRATRDSRTWLLGDHREPEQRLNLSSYLLSNVHQVWVIPKRDGTGGRGNLRKPVP